MRELGEGKVRRHGAVGGRGPDPRRLALEHGRPISRSFKGMSQNFTKGMASFRNRRKSKGGGSAGGGGDGMEKKKKKKKSKTASRRFNWAPGQGPRPDTR